MANTDESPWLENELEASIKLRKDLEEENKGKKLLLRWTSPAITAAPPRTAVSP